MMIRQRLTPHQMISLSGLGWRIELPPEIPDGDSVGDSAVSSLRLFEDGRPLGPAHAVHQDIIEQGAGRYSHWNRKLYLSSSDGSDPRHNGRTYEIEYDPEQRHDLNALAEAADYCISVASGHRIVTQARGVDIAGRTVLELGPGANLGEPLLLAAQGAKMVVSDRFVAQWRESQRPFYEMLRKRWNGPSQPLDQVLRQGSFDGVITVLDQPAENLSSIADATIEVVISNAVLEHLFDLDAAAAELWRVTAPGGWHFHQIDLRDHKDFTRPLEYLLYDAETYRKIQEHNQYERGCQWRAAEFRAAFAAQGFEIVDIEKNGMTEDAYIADLRPRLIAANSRYAEWPDEDLLVVGARFVLRRPN